MHLAPADRHRDVVLSTLPGGIFRLKSTGWAGLVLAHHRDRQGRRRECSVLLLHARGDDSPALRRAIRADVVVQVDAAHDVLLSTRNVTEADAFTRMNEIRTGRVLPGSRLHREPELSEADDADAPEADAQLPVAA